MVYPGLLPCCGSQKDRICSHAIPFWVNLYNSSGKLFDQRFRALSPIRCNSNQNSTVIFKFWGDMPYLSLFLSALSFPTFFLFLPPFLSLSIWLPLPLFPLSLFLSIPASPLPFQSLFFFLNYEPGKRIRVIFMSWPKKFIQKLKLFSNPILTLHNNYNTQNI